MIRLVKMTNHIEKDKREKKDDDIFVNVAEWNKK